MVQNQVLSSCMAWCRMVSEQWNRFWFTARPISILAALRWCFGALLLYSHIVLASDLHAFIGDHAWINQELGQTPSDGSSAPVASSFSYLWKIQSPFWISVHHLFTIVVTASWCVGLLTRVTGPLCWFLQLMYLHRLTGALFGFDQIITYAVMYLMIAPTGACWSVDRLLRERFSSRLENKIGRWIFPLSYPSVSANIATRLFQLHLCIIYLFGGLSKARGVTWWDGTAAWYALANLEYQSLDMTWLSSYPFTLAAMTTLTLIWELSYAALVWPRVTRPVVLAIAIGVHLGIALMLGMATFGIAMICANLIFIEPWRDKNQGSELKPR